LSGERTVRIEADGPVVGEVTRNANGTLVHLLNWNEANPLDEVKISVRMKGGRVPEAAEMVSPDRETQDGQLAFEVKRGRVVLTIPRLLCYDVVLIRW
jgi:hypothetical protein